MREGRTDPAAALERILAALRDQPFEDLGFAKVDHHRAIRQGFPEVILGLGKTPGPDRGHCGSRSSRRGHPLLVTRADEAAWKAVKAEVAGAQYHEIARCITLKGRIAPGVGTIVLCCAGTSDVPVAEEAAVTAELLGNTVDRIYDIGVAGLHRAARATRSRSKPRA